MKLKTLMLVILTLLIVMILVSGCVVCYCKKICKEEEKSAFIDSNNEGEELDASNEVCGTTRDDDVYRSSSCCETGSLALEDSEHLHGAMSGVDLGSVEFKSDVQFYCVRGDEGLQQDSRVYPAPIDTLDHKHFSNTAASMSLESIDSQSRPCSQACSQGMFQGKRSYSLTNMLPDHSGDGASMVQLVQQDNARYMSPVTNLFRSMQYNRNTTTVSCNLGGINDIQDATSDTAVSSGMGGIVLFEPSSIVDQRDVDGKREAGSVDAIGATNVGNRKVRSHGEKLLSTSKHTVVTQAFVHDQEVSTASSSEDSTQHANSTGKSTKKKNSGHIVDSAVLNESSKSRMSSRINQRSMNRDVKIEGTSSGSRELPCFSTGELRKQQYLNNTYPTRTHVYKLPLRPNQEAQEVIEVDPHQSLHVVLTIQQDKLEDMLLKISDVNLRNKIRSEYKNVYCMILRVIQHIDKEVLPTTIQSWVTKQGEALYKKHKVTLVRDCIKLLTNDTDVVCVDKNCKKTMSELIYQVESHMRSEYIMRVHDTAKKMAITKACANVLIMITCKIRSKHSVIQDMISRYIKYTDHPKKSGLVAFVSRAVSGKDELDILQSIRELDNFFNNKINDRTISVVVESLKAHMQEISSTAVRDSVVLKIRNSMMECGVQGLTSHSQVSCVMSGKSNITNLGSAQAKGYTF